MTAIFIRGYTGQLKQKGQMSGTLLFVIEGFENILARYEIKNPPPNSISKVRIKPDLQFITYIVNCNLFPVKYLGHPD